MLKCNKCGKVISEDDVRKCKEYIGDFDGYVAYKDTICKCECGGDFEDAKRCKICGEWLYEYEFPICDDCIEKEMTFNNAIKFGNEKAKSCYNLDEVEEVNEFFVFLLGYKNINSILKDFIEKHKTCFDSEKAKIFCEQNYIDFMDFIDSEQNDTLL